MFEDEGWAQLFHILRPRHSKPCTVDHSYCQHASFLFLFWELVFRFMQHCTVSWKAEVPPYGSKEYSNSGEGSEGIRQTRWKHLVKHDSYSRQHWVCFSPPSQGSIPSFFKVDVHHWRQSPLWRYKCLQECLKFGDVDQKTLYS